MKITCIDFETANRQRESACSLGIACIENGEITVKKEWKIKPCKGFGFFIPEFTEIHGMTWFDVKDSMEFDMIYPELAPHLEGAMLVAHNAAFDMNVLRSLLDLYKISYPVAQYFCTLQAARRIWPELDSHSLDQLCEILKHEFTHHHAGSDAEAAAHVLKRLLTETKSGSIEELSAILNLEIKTL